MKLLIFLALIASSLSIVMDYETLYSINSYTLVEDADSQAFIDPRLDGGSMLNRATEDLGEPLNVIISAKSDPHVLSNRGLLDFAKSVGFATECLNLHIGGPQYANLGDGQGWIKEKIELRQTYFPFFGTCWESYKGAVSMEKKIKEHHKILEDGYNRGRDELASKALLGGYGGGYRFRTSVEWIDNLLEPGSEGVNHAISGRNAPTVGRWIRKHVIDDDNLGELPDFTRWNANENKGTGIWSGRRFRSVALPSQLDSNVLSSDSIKSLVYFTEAHSEDFVHSLHERFPKAKKLVFPGGSVVGGGLIGFGSTECIKKDAPTINFDGYSSFSDVMEVTNASGNIILTLNNANACRQLLELLNKNRVDKEDEYYLAAYTNEGSIKSIHRITSGDPSRGAIALDTTEDLTLSHKVQFMKRESTSTVAEIDPTPAKTTSPSISVISSKYPLLSLPLEDAITTQDYVHIENEFIIASELGFNTSTNPEHTPWSCNVESSANLLL
ncbi:hypothetical protein E3Q23_03086 [Wallemia mellicola]|uniref:Uncharacterized protein n=1 Tax=Wallemia mellicola TaxID=1708541 RepID=A0A4T0SIR9_9BASI|nr:hypothetical protein E3Q23_03086 [Wallemia mellicola]TIC51819.1 hypothetical protein E3Q05_02980 [Wallemia mellicola]TIC66733.1 hypothetical protein E3Q01_01572 [Wallemia mellicola]